MSEPEGMGANLVFSARFKPDADQREPAASRNRREMRHGSLRARSACGDDRRSNCQRSWTGPARAAWSTVTGCVRSPVRMAR